MTEQRETLKLENPPILAADEAILEDDEQLEGAEGDEEAPTAKPQEDKKFNYATLYNPVIQAVIAELYRFPTKDSAVRRVQKIAERYRGDIEEGGESCVIWIRSYEVTPETEDKGYYGNFARVAIKQKDGEAEYLTLHTSLVDVPLSRHPQRRRPPRKHPNWNHDLLTAIKAEEAIYDSMSEARAALVDLALEYEDACVPGLDDKLFVYVYNADLRKKGVLPPIDRVIIQPREHEEEEDKFILALRTNKSKKGGGGKGAGAAAMAAASASMGR